MPVYSITSNKTLPDHSKRQLVDLITDTHCGMTGAPEQFVHVIFSDGIPITGGHELYIHANVRAGRHDVTKQNLRNTLITGSATILQTAPDRIKINLMEIQAKWVMEGGFVMPEPGEEDEWFKKVHAALAKRQ